MNFEQSVPASGSAYTRFIALGAGSYRLNVVLKDIVTGVLAVDHITFEVK